MSKNLIIYDQFGNDITDEMHDAAWLKDLINKTLDSINNLDEIDQTVDKLLLEGKQVAYYSDIIH
jgi:hypothetical protein